MLKFIYVFSKMKVNKTRTTLRLMIQIVIALFTISFTVAIILSNTTLERLYETTGLQEGTYYQPFHDNNFVEEIDNKYWEGIDKAISNMKDKYSIISVHNAHGYDEESNRVDIVQLRSNDIERFALPVEKGKWFNNKNADNIIPVVISSALLDRYEINNTYKLNFYYYIENKRMNEEIKIKIIGILKNSNYSYSLSGNSLTSIIKNDFNGFMMPHISNKSIPDVMKYNSVLFVPKDNALSNDDKLESSDLIDYGTLYNLKDMIKEYKDGNLDLVFLSGLIGAITLVLTIAGLGGYNMLSMIRRQREYSIYYMCGMKWRTSVLIAVVNDLTMMIIPALVSWLLIMYLNNTFFGDFIIIDTKHLLISIPVCMTVFSLSLVEPLINLRRYNPITFIRSCGK